MFLFGLVLVFGGGGQSFFSSKESAGPYIVYCIYMRIYINIYIYIYIFIYYICLQMAC